MDDTASVTFLGAAGTVTGSKHLVRAGATELLLDCGSPQISPGRSFAATIRTQLGWQVGVAQDQATVRL